MTADWPTLLRGISESIVTTLGPNDRWNVAALGIDTTGVEETGGHVTARTWGRTRTWRNFRDRGEGYVQFSRDPVVFVEAALSITERSDPVLAEADAWVQVSVSRIDGGTEGGTPWTDWELEPEASEVVSRVVPVFNRGYAAVIEGTVAASRLDVAEYDSSKLRDRLDRLEEVAMRCGGPREQEAYDRIRELTDEST